MAVYKIIPEDYISILTRIQNELFRRNGNGDLSSYSTIEFEDGDPISGDFITIDHFNKFITGLGYINTGGLPSEAIPGETYINSHNMNLIYTLLEAYESQPRGAISGNDCENLCSGMCITECTTTCLTTCSGTCSDTCTSDCAESCSDNCTGDCAGTCLGTCTSCSGSCTGTCIGGCTGSCTALCGYCTGTCQNACALACATGCTAAHMDD